MTLRHDHYISLFLIGLLLILSGSADLAHAQVPGAQVPGSPWDKPPQHPQKSDIEIPLNAEWKPEGPGATGGGYKDGVLELQAALLHPDAYAELFLDLRAIRHPSVDRNPDGSYNLAGKEIVAIVRSEPSFKGDSAKPNGAQVFLKNAKWENLVGTWLNVSDAIASRKGMEVFYKAPDHAVAKSVAGISLKFTIGSRSPATFKGRLIVDSIKIVR